MQNPNWGNDLSGANAQASPGMVMTEGSAEFKRGIRRGGNPGSGRRDVKCQHRNLDSCAIIGDDIVF